MKCLWFRVFILSLSLFDLVCDCSERSTFNEWSFLVFEFLGVDQVGPQIFNLFDCCKVSSFLLVVWHFNSVYLFVIEKKMLTCIACTKQLNNGSLRQEEEEEAVSVHTPSTKQAIKALTSQVNWLTICLIFLICLITKSSNYVTLHSWKLIA